ncbi:MAG: hypothetical protein J5693_04710, partial [Bacteroidales bacterium]|nr:hypothetical protein [Bacteroidales bacterium]
AGDKRIAVICFGREILRPGFAVEVAGIVEFDAVGILINVRRTGSAAIELCLLESGYADLYFEIRIMPWDYTAATLILKEAGGAVCSFDGASPSLFKPSMYIAANTSENCNRILQPVRRHMPAAILIPLNFEELRLEAREILIKSG